jgi:hypothetical protein
MARKISSRLAPFACKPLVVESRFFLTGFSETDDPDLVMAVCVD